MERLGKQVKIRVGQSVRSAVAKYVKRDPQSVLRLASLLFNTGRTVRVVPEFLLVGYLRLLFAERRLDLFQSLIEDNRLGHADARLYFRERLAHYRGTDGLSRADFDEIFARPLSPRLRRLFIDLALEGAIRRGDADAALALIGQSTVSPTATHFVGVIRLLIKVGRKSEAEALLQGRLKKAAASERVYFLELATELLTRSELVAFGFPPSTDWRALTRETVRLTSGLVGGSELDQYVLQRLLEIPDDHRDLMDIRLSADQRDRLSGMITGAIRERQSFSLLRLGDGEAYALDRPRLDGATDDLFQSDDSVRELHWWNGSPDEALRERIALQVRDAIGHASVIGIPSIYRVIRDIGPQAEQVQVFGSRPLRGLLTVVNALGRDIPIDGPTFTEERCHQILFDEASLRQYTEAAGADVVVVSCWNAGHFAGSILEDARFVYVPPPTKVRDEDNASDPRLYEVYDDIDAEVARHSAPGTLVLVGGGLIGKIFLRSAQREGAVALDVGSMLDYMAGRKTRSILDLV